MATNQKLTVLQPENQPQRETTAMSSHARLYPTNEGMGRRIPSALLARLQVMFTSGASLEEVCEALEIDTTTVRDAETISDDPRPIDPPDLSEKKLDALTSLVAALRHQVAALVQISEDDGASYSHVVGPISATAHALAMEVDDLRNGDARVYRDENKADRKHRVAAQRARPVANDDAGQNRNMTPETDLARLQNVRKPAAKVPTQARQAAEPTVQANKPATVETDDFETAAADARQSEKPKPNPLADVLTRTRSAKPAKPAPKPEPAVAKAPVMRVAPAPKPSEHVNANGPDAASSPGVVVAKGALDAITDTPKAQRAEAKTGAFDNIATSAPPVVQQHRSASRPRSPEVKPIQPAHNPAARTDTAPTTASTLATDAAAPQAAPLPAPVKQFDTTKESSASKASATSNADTVASSNPTLPKAESKTAPMPAPVKRFDAPKASSALKAPAASNAAMASSSNLTLPKAEPKTAAPRVAKPQIRDRAQNNPFRSRLSSAMGQIKDMSKGAEDIDDEAFAKLR